MLFMGGSVNDESSPGLFDIGSESVLATILWLGACNSPMIVITLTYRTHTLLILRFICLLEEDVLTLSVFLGSLQSPTTRSCLSLRGISVLAILMIVIFVEIHICI